jgi:hypothetical protein
VDCRELYSLWDEQVPLVPHTLLVCISRVSKSPSLRVTLNASESRESKQSIDSALLGGMGGERRTEEPNISAC